MDKSWIEKPRHTHEYLVGLNQFLDFAFTNAEVGGRIKCPCPLCKFAYWQTRDVAFNHLICKQFPQNYVTWTIHGERNVLPTSRAVEVTQDILPLENPVELLINEAFGSSRHEDIDVGPSQVAREEILNDTPPSNENDFFELLRDGSQELYDGSKYSKLEFLLKLYHVKCLSGLSDKRARESTHHWTVDGIDSQGNVKRLKLKTNEVLSLPQGVRVVVQFDLQDPIGEASSLLAGFCGILATDCSIFPIGFEKWPDMPQSYFEDCFDNIIKPLFSFMAPEEWARRHVYHSIVKKWGASRQKLWREFHDPLKTKEQHMANVPIGIARDQWTSYVNYRLKDKTVRMCLRNAENRKKLTDPHGGGSKSNARRRGEIIVDTGRRPGRAEMYLITRKKEDGSYVSEGAKEICEKLELALSQSTVDESQASPNDAVGKVLGKEHPGRVRCMGLGATPSIAFKQTNRRVSSMRFPSNDAGCSSSECQVKYNQLLNTLKAYMIMKEGSIPEQFAGIFDSTPTTPRDAASGHVSPMNARRSVSASNFSDDVLENPLN